MSKKCGNPNCGVSTGICERATFGSGELNDYGYWEFPCRICAKAYEEKYPGEEAWPAGPSECVECGKELTFIEEEANQTTCNECWNVLSGFFRDVVGVQ